MQPRLDVELKIYWIGHGTWCVHYYAHPGTEMWRTYVLDYLTDLQRTCDLVECRNRDLQDIVDNPSIKYNDRICEIKQLIDQYIYLVCLDPFDDRITKLNQYIYIVYFDPFDDLCIYQFYGKFLLSG